METLINASLFLEAKASFDFTKHGIDPLEGIPMLGLYGLDEATVPVADIPNELDAGNLVLATINNRDCPTPHEVVTAQYLFLNGVLYYAVSSPGTGTTTFSFLRLK